MSPKTFLTSTSMDPTYTLSLSLSLCLLGFFRFCYLNLHGFSIWIWFLNFWHLGLFPVAFFVLDMILISALFFLDMVSIKISTVSVAFNFLGISFSMVFQCLYCLVRQNIFPRWNVFCASCVGLKNVVSSSWEATFFKLSRMLSPPWQMKAAKCVRMKLTISNSFTSSS